MNIYEFGGADQKSLVMIHGACMSWDMFQDSIDELKEDFHIFAVAVPGHDLTTNEEFTTVEDIADRIETKLISRGQREIDVLYGLSMGGGFVIRMLADNRLHVNHAVIDAGITPYELPRPITRLILLRDFLMTEWGKHSKKALSLAFPPEKYTQEGIDYMHKVMRHMSAKTIWRVFDSTDNYSVSPGFPVLDTLIEYWYGQDEKRARKLDIAWMKKHIPSVWFREIPGMDHGQYALMQPKQFAEDLRRISGAAKELERSYQNGLVGDLN